MSFNFGARVGDIIKGNLARGVGGRFVNAAELEAQEEQIKNQVTLRLSRARKGLSTGSSLEAAIARIQARFAEIDALRAQANRRGKAPAKPKAAGGGSKGASEKRQENREKFIKMPPAELNGVNAKAFLDFADGGDLGPDEAKKLAGKGLVEFGDDGKPRLTSTGRGLLAAMNAGDRRRVQDALSRGQDKANKLMERYKEFAAQAQELGMQVEALANEILNLEQLINQSTDANEREVLLMQLEKYLVKQAKLEESAAKAQARAAEVGRRLGLEGPDEAKEKSLSSFRSSIRANVRGLW
ncbi:MAG TPA: hypothetical protein VEC96_02470, partial [Anaerolineae bacterium]|nr:hypothetical protein [Anaerolineae bacterium]